MAPQRLAPTPRSRLRRLHKRGCYDFETIAAILDAGLIAHVGYVIDGQPFVTPTAYWREGSFVYWHGSRASRAIKRIRDGAPVCFAVSLLDGIVFARSGFHHSLNYRSVMLFGRAHEVLDEAEKRRALDHFIDRLAPGRAAQLRAPTARELKATSVLAMAIEEGAAKIRSGPPKDEEEDYGLPIWAGVVPLTTRPGAPIPDPNLGQGIALPESIAELCAADDFARALAATAHGRARGGASRANG